MGKGESQGWSCEGDRVGQVTEVWLVKEAVLKAGMGR